MLKEGQSVPINFMNKEISAVVIDPEGIFGSIPEYGIKIKDLEDYCGYRLGALQKSNGDHIILERVDGFNVIELSNLYELAADFSSRVDIPEELREKFANIFDFAKNYGIGKELVS